jgi:thioredoxin 1
MMKKNVSATIVLLGMVAVLVSCFTRPPTGKKPESGSSPAAAGAICETVPQPASAATEPTPAPVKPAPELTEKPLVAKPPMAQPAGESAKPVAAAPKSLPRMWDFGSENCIPCKTMMGILTPMMKEFAGKVDVRIVNVYQEQALASQYRIQIIPTQVFMDTTGKELFRHVGVLTRDSILAKFNQFGFTK